MLIHRPRPDNYTYLARSRGRKNYEPGVLGSYSSRLGDYIADMPYQVLETTGGSGGRALGPLSYPIVQGSTDESVQGLLKEIRDLLYRMPMMLQNEFRTRFIMRPREAVSFISPSTDITVAAGTAVAIVSETVDERFTGFLTHVGVNVLAPGSFSSIAWQIRVNGAIHPKFANRVFSTNTLATPLEFPFELTQSRTVQLVALNTSAVPVTVNGLLVGWTEFMSTYKSYGSSPQSGVA